MKVIKGSLFQLPSSGRMTLQIPDIAIGSADTEYEEIPDDWVVRLRYNAPVVGKEVGFLFWSEKGYNINKEKIY